MKRTLKKPLKKRRVVEKEAVTALLELANEISLKSSSNDLSLREERIDGKNVNEGTANDKISEEKTNIDDFIESSPVGRFSTNSNNAKCCCTCLY